MNSQHNSLAHLGGILGLKVGKLANEKPQTAPFGLLSGLKL